MKIVALIAAAGKGKRMNARINKPFIPIFGKPILAYRGKGDMSQKYNIKIQLF